MKYKKFKKINEGSKGVNKTQEDTRRLKKTQEGSRFNMCTVGYIILVQKGKQKRRKAQSRFKNVQAGFTRFNQMKGQEGSIMFKEVEEGSKKFNYMKDQKSL